MDLVTHNQVLIAALPAKIWPYILDPNTWKTGAQLRPSAGCTSGAAARFTAAMAEEPQNILFSAENVELLTERRRTLRLNALDGTLVGFVTWRLTPLNDATLLEYDVYCQISTPGADDQRRFAAELIGLKELVEVRP